MLIAMLKPSYTAVVSSCMFSMLLTPLRLFISFTLPNPVKLACASHKPVYMTMKNLFCKLAKKTSSQLLETTTLFELRLQSLQIPLQLLKTIASFELKPQSF